MHTVECQATDPTSAHSLVDLTVGGGTPIASMIGMLTAFSWVIDQYANGSTRVGVF